MGMSKWTKQFIGHYFFEAQIVPSPNCPDQIGPFQMGLPQSPNRFSTLTCLVHKNIRFRRFYTLRFICFTHPKHWQVHTLRFIHQYTIQSIIQSISKYIRYENSLWSSDGPLLLYLLSLSVSYHNETQKLIKLSSHKQIPQADTHHISSSNHRHEVI